jgi:hypothetical protein
LKDDLMKKIHGLATMALALSLAAGCARSDHAAPSPVTTKPAAASTEQAALPASESDAMPAAKSRALITTAELHVTTSDVKTAAATIRSEVQKIGGYISDATESGSGDARSASLEARVPADQTRELRVALSDLGEIAYETEKVEDVTDARADLDARLANSRAEEKRIVDIMSQRAGSIVEVLSAERELSRVRETIERLEAQKRSMDGRIALATVKIHVRTSAAHREQVEAWRTPGTSISGAFGAGIRGAAALSVYAAMAIAASAPFLLPIGLMLALVMTLARSQRKRRAAALGDVD